MAATRVEEYVEAGAVVAAVAGLWATTARAGVSRRYRAWIAWRRARETSRAASVAAIEDREMFDPAYVKHAVVAMLQDAAVTWRDLADEPARPGVRLDGALGLWAETHFQGWGSALHGRRSVDLLRLINREQDIEDRVVVRVRFAIHRADSTGRSDPRVVHYDERWTLAHNGSDWHLLEFDSEPLARELLRAPQIASISQDSERLAQLSLEDLAHDSLLSVSVDGLTSAEAAPYAQLLDLSLINARFAPMFIETTLTQLVEAWEESTTGSDQPLRARATGRVAEQLTTPETAWRSTRLILRDSTLTSWQPIAVITSDPAEVTLTATVTAVRYLVATTGAPVAGASDIRHQIVMRWTLRQTERRPSWQLVETSNPASDIPGATSS